MSHHPSGRSLLGISLALTTALLWGLLPIALKISLTEMDAYSITWYRFAVSALLLGAFMVATKQLPPLRVFSGSFIGLLLVAGLGLLLNYIFYLLALDYLNPETAQVVIQLSPFLVLLGGVLIFKEPFSHTQKIGALILLLGMLTFFNENLITLFGSLNDYSVGVALMMVAVVTWAGYALIQKKLLKSMTSMQLMLFFYILGGLFFWPISEPLSILKMDSLAMLMLLFCCFNTLIGYGSFSAAMEHVHASQVSAIVTMSPIVTFIAMFVAIELFPAYFEVGSINTLAYLGGGLVVLGSFMAVVGKKRN